MPEHPFKPRAVGRETGMRRDEHIIDEVTTPGGGSLNEYQVVGGEQRCTKDLEQAPGPGHPLPVVRGAVAPAGQDVDPDLHLPRPRQDVASHTGLGCSLAHDRLAGSSAKTLQRRGVHDRLEEAGLAGAVVPLHNGQPLQRGTEFDTLEVAKIVQFEP